MTEEPPPRTSWKDNPLIVAATTAVATMIFSVTVIVPIITGSLQNDVADLKHDMRDAPNLRQQNAELTKQLEQVKANLADAQLKHWFEPDSPYPIGLQQVKLGDSADAIDAAYPADHIDKKRKSYWIVRGQHEQFYDVTYFLEFTPKTSKWAIKFMSLFLKQGLPLELLHTRLVATFGQPQQRPHCFLWKLSPALYVYQNRVDSGVPADKELAAKSYYIDTNEGIECKRID